MTVLTGASVTVMEEVPVLVSLIAVIVVAPAPTAVTRPFPSTVAADWLLEVHVTKRPVSTLPFASLAMAAVLTLAVPAAADDAKQDFKLVNKTGYELKEIYVSPAKKNPRDQVVEIAI